VITVTGIVSPTLSEGTVITNSATIASDITDDNPEDNSSQVSVLVMNGGGDFSVFLPMVPRD
jgi:hypothetical protein